MVYQKEWGRSELKKSTFGSICSSCRSVSGPLSGIGMAEREAYNPSSSLATDRPDPRLAAASGRDV